MKKTTKREVKMLNVLKDKSVVKMIEAFKRKGRLYLVFEFMDRNLLEVLEEKPDGLDRESVKFFIYQLLKAVDYFHSQNVMHRDLKAENLLVTLDVWDHLKVMHCDFGGARDTEDTKTLDSNIGSPYYIAPEVDLRQPYHTSADVFSVGVLVYFILKGKVPYGSRQEYCKLEVKSLKEWTIIDKYCAMLEAGKEDEYDGDANQNDGD